MSVSGYSTNIFIFVKKGGAVVSIFYFKCIKEAFSDHMVVNHREEMDRFQCKVSWFRDWSRKILIDLSLEPQVFSTLFCMHIAYCISWSKTYDLEKLQFAKNNYCYVSIYSESFTVKMKKKNYFGCGQRFLQLMRENIIL